MRQGIIAFAALAFAAMLLFGCTQQADKNSSPSTTDNTTPQGGIDITPQQPDVPAGNTDTGTTADSTTPSHTIRIQNYSFNPESVIIKAGDKVIWNNFDTPQHTVVSDTGLFNSGLMPKGRTFEHTFGTAGTYGYHCSVHTSMTGTIIVQ